MDFLKKNYEKLILAVLLGVFICLLAVQLMLWKESAAIRVEKLKQFRDPPPNYQKVKFELDQSGFRVYENLNKRPSWDRSASRGDQKVYTDLMQPYAMALCPNCMRVIPASSFPLPNTPQVRQCPLCAKDLNAPQRPELHANLDTDGDGIPDRMEKVLGLNMEDRTDGNVDSDADDFTNYEEYLFKTKLNDPKSRPAYYTQFYVSRIVRPALPFRLKNVTIPNRNKPETAMIQIEVDLAARRRKRDYILKVSDTFQTMAGRYKITKVTPRFTRNRMGIDVSSSDVTVVNEETKESIVMKTGVRVLSSKDEIHLVRQYLGREKDFELYIGSEFTIGTMKTGVEKYKVVSANAGRKEVIVLFNGKKIKIGRESLVNAQIRKAPKVVRPPRKKKKK